MLSNYFKVLLRNLRKNKFFSAVNIFGLALGLACCMLIALYVNDETNFDRHHDRAGDLYLIGTRFINLSDRSKVQPMFNTPSPLGEALRREFPEIEKSARTLITFDRDKTLIRLVDDGGGPGKASNETAGYFADSTYFEFFRYEFIEGDARTALNAPGTLVLRDDIARKFFGDAPALGRTLRISNSWFDGGEMDFRVTGVIKKPAAPSHLNGRFFMSIYSGELGRRIRDNQDLATNNMFSTYLRLTPGADARALEAKLPAFVEKYMSAALKARGFGKEQFLVGVPDVHLSGVPSAGGKGGSRTYLYILGSIAVFTLLIACVNFMNLSTARSARRAGEVGVRKAIGASRQNLVGQFLGESLVVALLAFVAALLLAGAGLPLFNRLAERELSLSPAQHPGLFAGFLLLAVVTGLLAGLYPAFFLASFRPVEVLKGRLVNSLSAAFLRKGLVVFQFVISAGLILASLVIALQMRYLQSKDLGFQRERQIVIPLLSKAALAAYTPLTTALAGESRIERAGASLYYPGIMNPSDMGLRREGQATEQNVNTRLNWVDSGFMPALGIEPVAGRLFSSEFPTDTLNKLIINETAARRFGFATPDAAVGQMVLFDWQDSTHRFEVLGVVRDFHFEDLHRAIEPYGFFLNPSPQFNYLLARARTDDLQPLLASLESTWRMLVPGEPFEYTFLDDDFQKNYRTDRQMAALVGSFTGFAIVISCLGLFGLATFAAERRTKEIGIRKVLGASATGITALLARDFLKLVAMGIAIASPLGWWVMRRWLDDFAYRIELAWWMFLVAAAMVVVIAFLTVGYQSVRAALGNPVRALRSE